MQEVECHFQALQASRKSYAELVRLAALLANHYQAIAHLHQQLHMHTGTMRAGPGRTTGVLGHVVVTVLATWEQGRWRCGPTSCKLSCRQRQTP